MINLLNTFSNPDLQKKFEEFGYVIVEGISKEEITLLKEKHNNLIDKEEVSFSTTMLNKSIANKKQVNSIVQPLTEPLSKKYLSDHKFIVGSFICKKPAPDSQIFAHQDWSLTDERYYLGVNIWIPLIDTTEENGTFYVLKYSPELPLVIRGSNIPPALNESLFTSPQQLTPILIKAGQALIYDLSVIHLSPPNFSDEERVAIGAAFIPTEAPSFHYYLKQETKELVVYEAPPEFYANYIYAEGIVPEEAKVVSVQPNFETQRIPDKIQLELLAKQHPRKQPIFKNQEHQEQYERDGYIVMDYLKPNEVSNLLSKFEELNSNFKEGFLSSVFIPSVEHRSKVYELLEPLGTRFINSYMNNYEVMICTFMIKGAGKSSALYPHQDWTFVDEINYASFNLWIPLVDVNSKNGAMSIMKGGHKLPFSVRGSGVPDPITDFSKFAPDELTYLEMKAGQAVIYDHRCVHVSPSNVSGKVRPACAIGIVPKGTEHFHLYYDKENSILQRYKADKQFFFDHVITQLTKPEKAVLLDEKQVQTFKKFSDDELAPVLEKQVKRKKGFIEKIFSNKVA